MKRLNKAELVDLKKRNPCDAIAQRWVKLRKVGDKFVGPCPVCSTERQSRTARQFEATVNGWVCAVCGDGGDVIKLVRKAEDLSFAQAVAWLSGSRQGPNEDAENFARADDTHRHRDRKRKAASKIWSNAQEAKDSAVAEYLRARNLELPSNSCIRYAPNFPMWSDADGELKVVHRGPVMLAQITGADGKLSGTHITYIDLSQTNGKVCVADPQSGKSLPAKKVRGVKTRGRIELVPHEAPKRLIVGEGIETVLLYMPRSEMPRTRHSGLPSTSAIWQVGPPAQSLLPTALPQTNIPVDARGLTQISVRKRCRYLTALPN